MGDRAFAVGPGHMNTGKMTMGRAVKTVETQDVVQSGLIGALPRQLKLGHLTVKILQCRFVGHTDTHSMTFKDTPNNRLSPQHAKTFLIHDGQCYSFN